MSGVALDMPGEFPLKPFMELQERVGRYVDSHNNRIYLQYAAAWN